MKDSLKLLITIYARGSITNRFGRSVGSTWDKGGKILGKEGNVELVILTERSPRLDLWFFSIDLAFHSCIQYLQIFPLVLLSRSFPIQPHEFSRDLLE